MKRRILTTLLATTALLQANLSFAKQLNEHNLTEIVTQYIAAKNAVQQKDSTKADIEHMVSFMLDDIQTEHKPHVFLQCVNDGKGKDGFREGLGYYLGKYESSKHTILDITEGINMVSVKFAEEIKFMRDGKLMTDKGESLYILEFDGKLISREFRYDL